MGGDNSVE